MNQNLWRVQGKLHQVEQFENGLNLHVRYSPLTTVLMKIGPHHNTYVQIKGCEGCLRQRHEPGCYTELFERLIGATCTEGHLYLISRGLATRPYTTIIFAQPTKDSKPILHAHLEGWKEARLIQFWKRQGSQIRTALLLATSSGANAADMLRQQGWRPQSIPVFRQSLTAAHIPTMPGWVLQPWSGSIALPLQREVIQEEV